VAKKKKNLKQKFLMLHLSNGASRNSNTWWSKVVEYSSPNRGPSKL
jgi:hypothetical protein